MKFYLFFLLSWLPLFSISDDDNFGTILKTSKNVRFSLIKLPLGTIIIHFFTFSKNDKYRLLRIIKFKEIQKYYIEDEVKEKIKIYNLHLDTLSDDAKLNEIDFFKHKINLNISIKNKQFNKIMLFSTFILALIPFLIISPDIKNIIFYIYITLLSFAFINILIWVISFSKVKEAIRSAFGDLKKKNGDLKQSAECYYTDWICINKESQIEVGYSKNIEKIFLIIIILVFLYTMINIFTFNPIINKFKIQSSNKYALIVDSKKDVVKNLDSIQKFIIVLKNYTFSKVVLIYNKNNANDLILADNLKNLIKLYRPDIVLIESDNINDRKKPFVILYY